MSLVTFIRFLLYKNNRFNLKTDVTVLMLQLNRLGDFEQITPAGMHDV